MEQCTIFDKKINVLFECNSCRDYAFAKSFSQSPILNKLFLFGNNSLAEKFGIPVYMNSDNFLNLTKEKNIDLFISFNEQHSLSGLINYYKYNLKIPSIGVTRYWFYLEASKRFAKNFMLMNSINTPEFIELHSVEELSIAVDKFGFPFILKFNGLSAGFGVYKVNNIEEAKEVINSLATRSAKEHIALKCDSEFDCDIHVIAEEYISGDEISLLSLWDGQNLKTFLPIKDYKKAFDDDKGPNTGGLGGYMPYSLTSRQQHLVNEYLFKLKQIFEDFKPNFTGFIYSGIMFSNDKLYVLEYNMRPGDPEGQILSSHLKTDLLSILYVTAIGKLNNIDFEYKDGKTGCVVLANNKYFDDVYKIPSETKNCPESIIYTDNLTEKIDLFLGSTLKQSSESSFVSDYPTRLISFCNTSDSPFDVLYSQLETLNAKNIYFRRDIGK